MLTRLLSARRWLVPASAFAILGCSGAKSTTAATIDEVAVSPAALTLLVGAQQPLTATPKEKGSPVTGRTVTWSSGNAAVATVSTAGGVTAVSAGNTVITATSDGISGTATVAVSNPAPTVSQIAPATAAAGSPAFILTVTGTGFVSGSTAQWNGAAVPTTVISSTQLTAGIPAADILTPGSATITVLTPTPGGGTSGTQTFTITAAPNPAPTVASLSPSTTSAGGAAFTLTINGTNFVAASQGMWNGTTRTTTFVSATQLHVAILAGDIASPNTAQVTVVNPTPGGGTSTALPFSVTAPVLAITTVLPSAIVAGSPQQLISVIGTNFVAGSQVMWNGTARNTTFISSTQLVASVAAADVANTGAEQITVVNPAPAGGTSPAKTLTVDSPTQLGGSGTSNFSDHCGAKPNAPLYCWGYSVADFSTLLVPTAAPGGAVLRQFSQSGEHICGVTLGGAGLCWGNDAYLQLGDIDPLQRTKTSPVSVAGGFTWSMITTGDLSSCGITTAGVTYCWGDIDGTSHIQGTAMFVVPGGQTFTTVTVGTNHACGLTATGAAYCWGRGAEGELGNGATSQTDVGTPVPVSGNHIFIALSAGGSHTCGVEAGGAIWCWGAPESAISSLGDGTSSGSSVPVQVAGGHIFQAVSAGEFYTCAIDAANTAWCWGDGSFGVLGSAGATTAMMPLPVSGGFSFRSIAAGGATCGVLTNGNVNCWGNDHALGNGYDGASTQAVAVSGGLTFVDIALTGNQTCAITAAGATYCWGTDSGAGDPAVPDAAVPTLYTGVGPLTALSEGEGQICGRNAAGAAFCWGSTALTATAFPAAEALVSLQTSDLETCGLSSAGTAYCSGHIFPGSTSSTTTTEIYSGHQLKGIGPAGLALCGLPTSGLIQCVGPGSGDAIGGPDAATLTQISGTTVFTSMSGNAYGVCGIATTGQGFCWGDPNTNFTAGFQPVPGGLTFSQISVGGDQNVACGISSGSAVCWGTGLLRGTQATITSASPVSVAAPPLNKMRTGRSHSCGLTPLGAAWCWGGIAFGQLGDGDLGFTTLPTLVTW